MLKKTNIPIMKKAVQVIYDISEDTRLREIARLREKALHDEASALKNAREEGIEEGITKERTNTISKMKALGFTEEQIRAVYPI